MSDQLLIVLRVCLLVFVYLVFLRILRAIWMELKGGAAAQGRTASVGETARDSMADASGTEAGGGPAATRSAPVLIAVEPSELAGRSFTLDVETTIGRAAGCRISIDDTHVSKLHARVFVHEGRWFVEDLGSTNGTLVNEVLVGGTSPVEPGDHIRVGETVLELR